MHHYNIIFINQWYSHLKTATQCTTFCFLEGTQLNLSESYVPVVVHSQSLIPEQDNPLQ